jgi:predicted DsbA family dithiol-disulfide isomerase
MNKTNNSQAAEANTVTVTYYTDPLCCWCRAIDVHILELEKGFGDVLKWRYCMGGLIPDWKTYSDSRYDVFKPSQMSAHWLYVSRVTGIPLNHTVWVDDPPASSYPACLAVKCAGLQSAVAEKIYLQLIQKAVMENGWNIAKKNVLIRVAKMLKVKDPQHFSVERFADELESEEAREAFRKDLREMNERGITQLPSMILHKAGAKDLVISGYRSLEQLTEIFSDFTGLMPIKKTESENVKK